MRDSSRCMSAFQVRDLDVFLRCPSSLSRTGRSPRGEVCRTFHILAVEREGEPGSDEERYSGYGTTSSGQTLPSFPGALQDDATALPESTWKATPASKSSCTLASKSSASPSPGASPLPSGPPRSISLTCPIISDLSSSSSGGHPHAPSTSTRTRGRDGGGGSRDTVSSVRIAKPSSSSSSTARSSASPPADDATLSISPWYSLGASSETDSVTESAAALPFGGTAAAT
mmetsp:Transcript_30879/g.70590  ORF Transcript_30879/g.70590 Transcript_30879/m.70590 type:complete len:229 (-) Transcript_30879:55-741(-)